MPKTGIGKKIIIKSGLMLIFLVITIMTGTGGLSINTHEALMDMKGSITFNGEGNPVNELSAGHTNRANTGWVSSGFLILCLLLMGTAAALIYFKIRAVMIKVKSSCNYVYNGSWEIYNSAQELSQGTAEQANTTQEVSTLLTQLGTNLRENTDNVSQAEGTATKVSKDAEASRDALTEAVEALKLISQKISLIQEIARQTNLLALKASMEAVNANKEGKGFQAVVLEVGKLAIRTKNAAAEMTTLAASSVDIADLANQKMKTLTPDILKTANLVHDISTANIEYNIRTEQLLKALHKLEVLIQRNNGAAEKMISTAEGLIYQAEKCKEPLDFFKKNQESSGPPANLW